MEQRRHLFVTLWVMAFSFHYLDSHPLSLLPAIVTLAGLPCLIAPGSLVAFAVFLSVSTTAILLDLPAPSNHFVLALIVHLALLGSVLTVLGGRTRAVDVRSEQPDRAVADLWLATARTPAGLTLLVIYAFTVVHKLNADFFDPDVSCAGVLPAQGLRLLGIDAALAPPAVYANAWLTIGWESAVLLLLVVPRLQRWGVLVGVVAHAGLGLALFFDFATFVFALYVLLLPDEAMGRLRRPERWRAAALVAWGLFVVFAAGDRASGSAVGPIGLTWHALQALAWLVVVGALLGPPLHASFARDAHISPARWSFRPAWLLAVPALACLNGLTPYLGLKTVANYSMFSNLRTEEGVTNHLVPALQRLEMTEWLRDTVDIHELELPPIVRLGWLDRARGGPFWITRQTRWLREPRPARLPWLELRRAVWLWKSADITPIRIVYERNGIRRDVPDASSDPELGAPLSWWSRHLMAFRAVELAGNPVRCRW